MPPIVAKTSLVLLNQYDSSSAFKTFKPGRESDALDSSTFGTAAKTFLAGLKQGSIQLEGFFDKTLLSGIDAILTAAFGAAEIITSLVQESPSIGVRALLMNADQSKYEVGSPLGQIIMSTAEMHAADNGLESGVLLHLPSTLETATANATSVDNGAASTNGAVAHLHLTQITGLNVTVIVQHSTDNSTWVDLFTFTAASAITSQRLSVTGTVNRYRRVRTVVNSGSGNCNHAVTFAHR